MISVAVIIPYFQEKPGILRRALASVLQQRLPQGTEVDVIIVDDGSPLPARMEVKELNFAPPFRLQIVEQANGGVAAARNAGLKRVTDETTYIAFLDSDDIWAPDHLSSALVALQQDFDFYFCDGRRLGENHSSYAASHFDAFLAGPHAKPAGEVYVLENKPFFSFSVQDRPYMIPAVVYRRFIAPSLMFDPALYAAGEDCLFLFHLLAKSRRICCSARELVTFADGINIYAGSYDWENPRHLIRHMGIILSLRAFMRELPLEEKEQRLYASRLKKAHRIFTFLSLRYLLRKREFWPQALRKMMLSDSSVWLWYPTWAFYILVAYPARIYNPLKTGEILSIPQL